MCSFGLSFARSWVTGGPQHVHQQGIWQLATLQKQSLLDLIQRSLPFPQSPCKAPGNQAACRVLSCPLKSHKSSEEKGKIGLSNMFCVAGPHGSVPALAVHPWVRSSVPERPSKNGKELGLNSVAVPTTNVCLCGWRSWLQWGQRWWDQATSLGRTSSQCHRGACLLPWSGLGRPRDLSCRHCPRLVRSTESFVWFFSFLFLNLKDAFPSPSASPVSKCPESRGERTNKELF